jgi:hypothetical protein
MNRIQVLYLMYHSYHVLETIQHRVLIESSVSFIVITMVSLPY